MSTDAMQPTESFVNRERQGCLALAGLTAVRVAVHAFALFLIFLSFCGPVLEAEKFFEQEGLKIPEISHRIILWAHRLSDYFLILIPAFLLIDSAILAGLQSLPQPFRLLARCWFAGVLVGGMVLLTTSNAAIGLPLMLLLHPEKEVSAAVEETKPKPVNQP